MNDRLIEILQSYSVGTIAVSGGVDSMTLAFAAHQISGHNFTMVHAVSPAVPEVATQRVKDYAKRYDWKLRVIKAHEFEDPRYLANPLNRCFFCKTNLYEALSNLGIGNLISGTNLDDLSDFRPGLKAADNFKVKHPFVESFMTKNDIRVLARSFNLDELSALPASPCLASRVETGIRINPDELKFIDDVERLVQESLSPKTVRCRLRKEKIVISLDTQSLSFITSEISEMLIAKINAMNTNLIDKPIEFGAYKMGEAFLKATS